MRFRARTIFRTIAVFIIISILFSAYSFSVCSVSAAYYTAGADDLKSLGLFIGTDVGYDLDRAPTRAEAAVMLVRLLGKEAEAKDKNYAQPFTDVPDWAAPYVGYLYENQLTNGIGDNKFGSTGLCNEQMFCTFVLRALGYTEAAGDFTYDASFDFGIKIGIVDAATVKMVNYYKDAGETYEFWRDECVSIMCCALNTKIKGTETTLLEKLISDKAIDEKAAEAFISKSALVDELNNLIKSSPFDNTKPVSMKIKDYMNQPFAPGDIPDGVTVNYTNSMEIDVDLTVSGANYAALINMNMQGITSIESETYLKDGYLYSKSMGEKTKQTATQDDSVDSLLTSLDSSYGYIFDAFSVGECENIEKTVSNNNTVYKITAAETYYGSDASDANAEEKLYTDDVVMNYTFSPSGKLISVARESKESSGGIVDYETNTDITINASGDGVKIEFPDFSDYVESTNPDSTLPPYVVGV
ncbi:MAG: hypothetical protein FWD71_03770 [Oscillospiraceae bacterium]|nr:hypothetical protein [Oscillospiraceae bacterium]